MSDPERSIAALYERYHQSLYRFCFSIVGNAEDAQDALQNAMLKAVRALPGEEREIQLKPWLYRIAHNESIEILRKRREEAQVDPELLASAAGPEETAVTRERLRQLLADLAELPERQRAALVMRELSGLGFGEIGEALGTSEAGARQTVYEARLGLYQQEAGREMSCESVMRQISDADGRTMRRRDIRAHLRSCPSCRRFRDSIEGRSRDLAAIAPLPAAASAGILHALLGGTGGQVGAAGAAGAGTAGTSAASTIGVGAGKAVATSAVLKSAAAVAVVAALGVGAADRSGLVHVSLSSGGGGGAVSGSSATGSGGTGTVAAEAAATGAVATPGNVGGAQEASGKAATGRSGETSSKGGTGSTGSAGAGAPGRQGQGAATIPPPASAHGQETAAAHKAALSTPNGHAYAGSHHGSSGGHGRSKVHSHGHATGSHSGSSHSHGGGAGSAGSKGGSERQAKPPRSEAPMQPPATEPPGKTKSGAHGPQTQP